MPKRGSGFEVAAARTTFSPKRTMAEPPACLASFPVSMESCFPPAISTETLTASGFIDHPLYGQKGMRAGTEFAWTGRMPGGGWERTLLRLSGLEPAPLGAGRACYLRIPSLEITVLYRSESYFFNSSSRLRRLLTIIKSPRPY